MPSGYVASGRQDEKPTAEDLKNLVEEYDELFEKCMKQPLTNEEQKLLNELYDCMSNMEDAYWIGVSDEIVFTISDSLGIDFPMIRYNLGILPVIPKK